MQNSKLYAVLISAVFFAAIGCGVKKDGRVEVYPVRGKVMVGGQPAAGAEVVFQAASEELQGPGMPIPEGTTDENGNFQLTSYEPQDGAPAGDFKITVYWPEPRPANFSGIYDPKDRLKGRYSNADTTKLTATVQEGGGELPPFELQ